MNILVVGVGYVGLVTAAGFAEMGHNVACYDTDKAKIGALQGRCRPPFYEPDLERLLTKNRARLVFLTTLDTTLLTEAPPAAVFVCVGTPSKADGSANLSAVFYAAQELCEATTHDFVLAIKSTVPPGACAAIQALMPPRIKVVSNPEFLAEGTAVHDCLYPDRIVVGAATTAAVEVMREVYKPLMEAQHSPVHFFASGWATSELTKYAANTMLAARVALINELADVAETVGADIEQVRRAIGTDPRIGPQFLRAGIGFGGSCFTKDLSALSVIGDCSPITAAVCRTNRNRRTRYAWKICRTIGHDILNPRIAVWGLAFKPDTDDTRDSPALGIIRQLVADGMTVIAHDPIAQLPDDLAHYVVQVEDRYMALEPAGNGAGADALVLCTEWREYARTDWGAVKRRMRGVHVFDGRNLWEPELVEKAGLIYHGVGR